MDVAVVAQRLFTALKELVSLEPHNVRVVDKQPQVISERGEKGERRHRKKGTDFHNVPFSRFFNCSSYCFDNAMMETMRAAKDIRFVTIREIQN